MQRLIGFIFGIIGIVLMLSLFNSGNNTPASQWLSEGFQGLAFSIGWLSPFSDTVAYIIAVLFLIIIGLIFYKLGTKLYQLIAR